MSITQMMEACSLSHIKNFRKMYINPALEDGAIEKEFATSKHPHQRYRLTEKAIEWKKNNMKK